tara:strand:- start:74 stop:613 length:540 start_codon:yes stop_codon:yes gene_type:complete
MNNFKKAFNRMAKAQENLDPRVLSAPIEPADPGTNQQDCEVFRESFLSIANSLGMNPEPGETWSDFMNRMWTAYFELLNEVGDWLSGMHESICGGGGRLGYVKHIASLICNTSPGQPTGNSCADRIREEHGQINPSLCGMIENWDEINNLYWNIYKHCNADSPITPAGGDEQILKEGTI